MAIIVNRDKWLFLTIKYLALVLLMISAVINVSYIWYVGTRIPIRPKEDRDSDCYFESHYDDIQIDLYMLLAVWILEHLLVYLMSFIAIISQTFTLLTLCVSFSVLQTGIKVVLMVFNTNAATTLRFIYPTIEVMITIVSVIYLYLFVISEEKDNNNNNQPLQTVVVTIND